MAFIASIPTTVQSTVNQFTFQPNSSLEPSICIAWCAPPSPYPTSRFRAMCVLSVLCVCVCTVCLCVSLGSSVSVAVSVSLPPPLLLLYHAVLPVLFRDLTRFRMSLNTLNFVAKCGSTWIHRYRNKHTGTSTNTPTTFCIYPWKQSA
jgi:hypothetical protein